MYDNAHLCFDVDVIFTLSQYFLFSLKTSFLMKTTLWKYQTLALLLSSEREKSSEVQMTLYSIIFDNVFFILMQLLIAHFLYSKTNPPLAVFQYTPKMLPLTDFGLHVWFLVLAGTFDWDWLYANFLQVVNLLAKLVIGLPEKCEYHLFSCVFSVKLVSFSLSLSC